MTESILIDPNASDCTRSGGDWLELFSVKWNAIKKKHRFYVSTDFSLADRKQMAMVRKVQDESSDLQREP